MDVAVIDTLEGLRGVEADWNALALQGDSADLFGTFDWVLQWWESFGTRGPQLAPFGGGWDRLRPRASRPHAISVRERGRLVALLPLARTVGRWSGVPLRVLSPALCGHAPRTSIAWAGAAEPLMQAAVGALAADRSWDVWLLDGLPRGGVLGGALAQALLRHGLPTRAGEPRSYSVHAPHGSWNEYLCGRSQKLRQTLRKSSEALTRLGAVQLECHAEPAAVEAGMQRFAELDTRSWKAAQGESFGRDGALQAHYTGLARRFARRGACQLWLLRVDGADVAGLLCLGHRGRLYMLKTSYREEFAAAAPGVFLIARAFERAWQEGWEGVDFVARSPFTERWTSEAVEFAPLTVFRGRRVQAALRAVAAARSALVRARSLVQRRVAA